MGVVASGGTESTVSGYKIHKFTGDGTFTVTTGGDVEVLVVAGGGSGGGINVGGGGGAGGVLYDSSYTVTNQAYSITVGAGGVAPDSGSGHVGNDGNNSVFGTMTANGGGGGGQGTPPNNGGVTLNGRSGGSGGGGGGCDTGTAGQGGSATQGFAGGNGRSASVGSGGGGGKGSVGGNGASNSGGNGGTGVDYSSVFGTGVGASGWFAGGGGGGGNTSHGSGANGGGNGASGNPSGQATSATANTGSGGGGNGGYDTVKQAGAGGSGIVLIRYSLLPVITTEAASSITTSGFTANGTITDIGSSDVTIRGFAYKVGTSGDPLISDNEVHEDGTFSAEAYDLPITGLTDGVGYRVAAYATNTEGTAYGNTVQVTTTLIVTPTVTTQAVSSITEMTCTGNGNLTDKGNGTVTERGICYKVGSGQTPTISDSKVHDHTDSTGAFTQAITGLTAGFTYSFRAYAINEKGNGYGAVVEVTTPILTVTTQEVSDVKDTSSTANGTITALGDHTVDVRGFCWAHGGMGIDPLITDHIVNTSAGGYGLGAYSIGITGIPIGETYKIRAYATDAHRTVYGNVVVKKNMLRARLSLNIVNKHIGFKFANISGGILSLDKIRMLFNNKNERNMTIPLNINSHHFSIKFTNAGILKYASLNIETLGAR